MSALTGRSLFENCQFIEERRGHENINIEDEWSFEASGNCYSVE